MEKGRNTYFRGSWKFYFSFSFTGLFLHFLLGTLKIEFKKQYIYILHYFQKCFNIQINVIPICRKFYFGVYKH